MTFILPAKVNLDNNTCGNTAGNDIIAHKNQGRAWSPVPGCIPVNIICVAGVPAYSRTAALNAALATRAAAPGSGSSSITTTTVIARVWSPSVKSRKPRNHA